MTAQVYSETTMAAKPLIIKGDDAAHRSATLTRDARFPGREDYSCGLYGVTRFGGSWAVDFDGETVAENCATLDAAREFIRSDWSARNPAAPRKQTPRKPARVEFDDLPAVTPAKDSTVGTVIGERSDVYSLVPGDPCALTVPSATREGVTYTVRFHPETGALSCDCPGYLNAKPGKTCRHCATVAEDIPGMFPHFWPDVMRQDAPAAMPAYRPELTDAKARCPECGGRGFYDVSTIRAGEDTCWLCKGDGWVDRSQSAPGTQRRPITDAERAMDWD